MCEGKEEEAETQGSSAARVIMMKTHGFWSFWITGGGSGLGLETWKGYPAWEGWCCEGLCNLVSLVNEPLMLRLPSSHQSTKY